FFSSRRRHTRFSRDWSSDVCSSDLGSSLRGRPGRRRATSLTASPRRYFRTVFLEIFSSLAIARMLIPRRDKILISITASFVSIQGPVLLVHGRPRILNKGGSIVLSEKGQFPMSADTGLLVPDRNHGLALAQSALLASLDHAGYGVLHRGTRR